MSRRGSITNLTAPRKRVDPLVRQHKSLEKARRDGHLVCNRSYPGGPMVFAPHTLNQDPLTD